MKKKLDKIIFAGGGTGGHVYPALEVAKILKDDKSLSMVFFGTGSDFEKEAVAKTKIAYQKIFSGKFRRNSGILTFLRNIVDAFLLIAGILQSIIIFSVDRPGVIFSKGGFASLPTVLAGAVMRIPIIIHESDIVMGLANQISAKYAKRIAVAFEINNYPPQIRKKAFYAGLPVSQQFSKTDDASPSYILIFGGSQGARSLNNLVFEGAEELVKLAPIIHLTGENDFAKAKQIKNNLAENGESYQIFKFRSNMATLIAGARLVICRAGASSIFEVSAYRKNLLLVPIPRNVTSHQFYNAKYLEKRSMADLFMQENGPKKFVEAVKKSLAKKSYVESTIYFSKSAQVIAQAVSSQLAFSRFTENHKKIHFIGLSGVSMSLIAKIMKRLGKRVTGSDIKTGGHSAKNVKADTDLIVYSSAAPKNSSARVEHEAGEQYGIEIIKRSEMISRLICNRSVVAVSGMHGKTTTSALISGIFSKADYSPGILIGAQKSRSVNTGLIGEGGFFVLEACEYDGSFLDIEPTIAVITNIDEEHLDYFKGGMKQIKEAFEQFINKIQPGGVLIYCFDDPNLREVVGNCTNFLHDNAIKVLSYGFSENSEITIESYEVEAGVVSFRLLHGGDSVAVKTRIAGQHFALNLAASFAVTRYLGIPQEVFQKFVNDFSGVKGRFELYGKFRGAIVYYDYAHHPTELKSVFNAASEMYPKKRKYLIFEPHQQDRFNNLYEDFHKVLYHCEFDVICILPVYKVPGRDAKAEFTSRDLVDRLSREGRLALYFENYDETLQFLKKNLKKEDFVITVGATTVYRVAQLLVRKNVD